MKTIRTLLVLAIFTTAFITSCNKDKGLEQESYSKSSTARLNTELNNEDMEADINEFINKLENPSTSADMNYEEAFEYIEATLNYKYVNYDYSKCANTSEFTGEISISVDGDNNMTMAAIKTAYDSILNDWHNKYYSISETEKTPIVFDITEVTSTSVFYTMVVGYGYIDLSLWGDAFAPATSTFYKTAASQYTNQLNAYFNNNQIQWNPAGTRTYSWPIRKVFAFPVDYPSNPSTSSVNPEPLPPLGNGYTDYKLFKSYFTSGNNYHTNLNTTEYNYYYNMLSVIYLDVLDKNADANFIPRVKVEAYGLSPNFYQAYHFMEIYLGHRYWTVTPVSTL